MSFVQNSGVAGTAAPGAPEDLMQFCCELAEGLHAMAQPLTILRGTLAAMTLREEIDHQHYMEMSSRQVDRLCEVMASLQNLLVVKRYEPECNEFDLWKVLSPFVEDRRRELEIVGVRLTTNGPSRSAWVKGDVERTKYAVFAAVNMACAAAAKGDELRLSVDAHGDHVEIALENTCKPMGRLSASDRLCLASAEASIRSQLGKFAVMENPLRMVMSLPATRCVGTRNLMVAVSMEQAGRARASLADGAVVLTNFSFEAGD